MQKNLQKEWHMLAYVIFFLYLCTLFGNKDGNTDSNRSGFGGDGAAEHRGDTEEGSSFSVATYRRECAYEAG